MGLIATVKAFKEVDSPEVGRIDLKTAILYAVRAE
jgi:hypothetical protein